MPNHNADIQNPNKGTAGTNITWDKAQGNRGKQMNPNQQPDRQQTPEPPVGGAGNNHGNRP